MLVLDKLVQDIVIDQGRFFVDLGYNAIMLHYSNFLIPTVDSNVPGRSPDEILKSVRRSRRGVIFFFLRLFSGTWLQRRELSFRRLTHGLRRLLFAVTGFNWKILLPFTRELLYNVVAIYISCFILSPFHRTANGTALVPTNLASNALTARWFGSSLIELVEITPVYPCLC